MMTRSLTRTVLRTLLLLALLLVGDARLVCSQSQVQAQQARLQITSDPSALVRRVAITELRALDQDKPRWSYILEKTNASGATTRQIVETDQGLVARALAIAGKPLTAEQRLQDDARLQALLDDPSEQRRKQRDQQDSAERVKRIIRALPEAFIYQYSGEQQGPQGKMLRLTFTSNPRFSPGSIETQALRGMAGTLLIHAAEERLVRLEARTVQQINIGLGILGRLDKDGWLLLEQSRVADKTWKASALHLQLHGKALFFKTINIKVDEQLSAYRRVPDKLTLAQGVAFLRQPSSAAASPSSRAK